MGSLKGGGGSCKGGTLKDKRWVSEFRAWEAGILGPDTPLEPLSEGSCIVSLRLQVPL